METGKMYMKWAEVKAEETCVVGSDADGGVEFHWRGMLMAALGTLSQHRVQHRKEDRGQEPWKEH